MLRIALGAEFNSEKMFRDVAALSSKYKGVQLHTHVAENPVRLLATPVAAAPQCYRHTQAADITFHTGCPINLHHCKCSIR